MHIRDASDEDLKGIVAIYNDAVVHTTAIWNERTVDEADRARWLADRRAAGFPVRVAVDADEVIGYASYGPWRAFDGYRLSVEHSIYVRSDRRGGGVGRALLLDLIELAREAGLHAMVAAVTADNLPSIALHERLGFTLVGVHHQVGVKFGQWLDLAMLQLLLDDGAPR